ncbi:MAG TPA: carboxypeptidase-like regulatory domain-containing protein [Thermoanaerobaculia bacterium]|nr:carboxypeptidase-like regulatory domain-containing protein [Thermoanaerobaculia bacterium]
MRNTTRGLLFVALIVVGIPGLILFLLHWWMGPIFYSGEAIHARVIDETTGRPIAGAAVVAQWEEEFMGGSPFGSLHWAEAVTNARGEFTIPAWGPKFRTPAAKFTYFDPILTVYKSGYQIGGGTNRPAYVDIITRPGENRKESKLPDGRIIHPGRGGYSPRLSRRFSYWNGRDLVLQPARNEEEERQALRAMDSFIYSFGDASRFPRTAATLREDEETLTRATDSGRGSEQVP